MLKKLLKSAKAFESSLFYESLGFLVNSYSLIKRIHDMYFYATFKAHAVHMAGQMK